MRDMLSPLTVLERNKLRLEALRNQVDVPEDHRASPEQLAPYIVQLEDCIREAEAMLSDTFNFENPAHCKRFQRLMNHMQLLVERAFHISSINRDEIRQAGTRKPRLPEVDTWLDQQLKFDPDAKSPTLWLRFEAHYDSINSDPPIGIEAFKKRLTKARKRCK
jgi:hypothetical protein